MSYIFILFVSSHLVTQHAHACASLYHVDGPRSQLIHYHPPPTHLAPPESCEVRNKAGHTTPPRCTSTSMGRLCQAWNKHSVPAELYQAGGLSLHHTLMRHRDCRLWERAPLWAGDDRKGVCFMYQWNMSVQAARVSSRKCGDMGRLMFFCEERENVTSDVFVAKEEEQEVRMGGAIESLHIEMVGDVRVRVRVAVVKDHGLIQLYKEGERNYYFNHETIPLTNLSGGSVVFTSGQNRTIISCTDCDNSTTILFSTYDPHSHPDAAMSRCLEWRFRDSTQGVECEVCVGGWLGATCDQDHNECMSGWDLCPVESICSNTIGSYECVCRDRTEIVLPTRPLTYKVTCKPAECKQCAVLRVCTSPLMKKYREYDKNIIYNPLLDYYHINSTVAVKCKDGYKLKGPEQISCTGNEEWSDTVTCLEVRRRETTQENEKKKDRAKILLWVKDISSIVVGLVLVLVLVALSTWKMKRIRSQCKQQESGNKDVKQDMEAANKVIADNNDEQELNDDA